MVKRTSIVIAHRLTTIERCNRIAVLEDGVITEDGNFNQLQQNKGSFTKLQRGLTKKQD